MDSHSLTYTLGLKCTPSVRISVGTGTGKTLKCSSRLNLEVIGATKTSGCSIHQAISVFVSLPRFLQRQLNIIAFLLQGTHYASSHAERHRRALHYGLASSYYCVDG